MKIIQEQVPEKEKEPGLVEVIPEPMEMETMKAIARPRRRIRQADRVVMRILHKLPVRTLQREENVQELPFRI